MILLRMAKWSGLVFVVKAKELRRVATINARLCNIFCNDCTGTYHNMVADRDRKNCGVRAYRYIAADECCLPITAVSTSRPAVLKEIIHKHDSVRNETTFTNRYEFTDKRVRLNLARCTDRYSFLYFDKWAYKTVVPDLAIVKIAGFD
jgi:hypothetical protein